MSELTLVFFSPAQLALMGEIRNHPKLVEILKECPDQGDWAIQLGHIAAYCEVGLDGNYFEDELQHLYKLLFDRLVKMRGPLAKFTSTNPPKSTDNPTIH